jgi:hypothetical protein
MDTFELVDLMMPLHCARELTSPGEQQVSEVLFCFTGKPSVRFVVYIDVSILYSYSVSANEHDEDDMEEDVEAWTGNPNRKLWKSTCTRAALNVCSCL